MRIAILGAGPAGLYLSYLIKRRSRQADVTVIEYMKTPPRRDELKRLYARAGMTAREGLRAKEALAEELGLKADGVSEDKILDAMMEHPILINRPLVETDKGVKLCRPQEEVHALL